MFSPGCLRVAPPKAKKRGRVRDGATAFLSLTHSPLLLSVPYINKTCLSVSNSRLSMQPDPRKELLLLTYRYSIIPFHKRIAFFFYTSMITGRMMGLLLIFFHKKLSRESLISPLILPQSLRFPLSHFSIAFSAVFCSSFISFSDSFT